MQILYSYFRYDGSVFLGCALFVVCCKIISYRKMYIGKFVRRTSLFWLHALLSMSLFVSFSLPFPKWRTNWIGPIKIHNIDMGGILCVVSWYHIMSKWLNIVCTPPRFLQGRGGWASNQILKKGGLTGPQLLEVGCWERGGVAFFRGVAIFT